MWPISEVYFFPKMKFWPLITDQILIFTFWNWLGSLESKFGHQKCPKMGKISKVANHKTIAVCGLWLSWLKNFSHTVSRLDLPTLLLNKTHLFLGFPRQKFRIGSFWGSKFSKIYFWAWLGPSRLQMEMRCHAAGREFRGGADFDVRVPWGNGPVGRC